ncbi:MAG TPA: hypothetical protein VNQ80_08935 [Parapedobacter sp.]|nr:hypothetical protein [Parapedobacter sp.]HWK57449.1 hypothetical protein [Parapedobacter sp.]
MGNISARTGGAALCYDDDKQSFNNTAADAYIQPLYREPWVFPIV